jgi:uncharacterized protein
LSLRILNLTQNSVLATCAELATTERARVAGLLTRSALAPGEGLLIPRCNSIHTHGMKFPIDVIFFNPSSGAIVEAFTMQPWLVRKMPQYPVSMCSVLELPAGTIELTGSQKGDSIEVIENDSFLASVG